MMNRELHEDGGEEPSRRGKRTGVLEVLDESPQLLSPIPCASPSEEPQVDEVLSTEAEAG